jgi:hypothetical protein
MGSDGLKVCEDLVVSMRRRWIRWRRIPSAAAALEGMEA